MVAIAGIVIGGQLACASTGIPPGGPVDTVAPKVLKIEPDSAQTGVTPSEVLFTFDEVVSERPQSVPSLDGLFLISPRDGQPNVGWHRKIISVKPHRGWKPNTTYIVTMLPGITDLRGNVANTGVVTVFSTGPTLASSRLRGTVFNWLTGSVVPGAYLEARPAADSTIDYVAVADSMGTFLMRNLNPGTYRVRAIIDENGNRGLDPREAWDTTTVSVQDSARVELYTFPHDSVGARLGTVALRDSVTLEMIFDHPINMTQQLTPQVVDIKTADSATVPVLSVTRSAAIPDTIGSVRPRPSRAIPTTSLLVKLGIQIKQPTTMRIRTIGVQGLEGIPFTSDRTVTVAPPQPIAPPALPGPPQPGGKAPPTPPPPPPPASPRR